MKYYKLLIALAVLTLNIGIASVYSSSVDPVTSLTRAEEDDYDDEEGNEEEQENEEIEENA